MILTTKEFLTKVASVKLGKSCKIKNINRRKRITAIKQPKIKLIIPLNLGMYNPVKKFTNGRPAQAKRPRKTL